MDSTSVILLVILASVALSFAIAFAIVRTGRARATARLAEIGPLERSTAATSLGLTSLGSSQVRGTGTLALTATEMAFAQWRPDRLVRIPRPAITKVDTTREHLGRTMRSDVLRIRWRDPEVDGGEDTIALFVRDLDPWLTALGGARAPEGDDA